MCGETIVPPRTSNSPKFQLMIDLNGKSELLKVPEESMSKFCRALE